VDDVYITGNPLCPGIDKMAETENGETISIIGAKYFPFPTARPGQKQFMEDISSALREGKNLVAYAPTGIGKTVAALTTMVSWCKAKEKKLLFLTSKHSQHNIAVETLRMIKEKMEHLGVIDIIAKEKMCSIKRTNGMKLLCQADERYDNCPLKGSNNISLIEHFLSNILHVEELVKLAHEADICPYKAAVDAAVYADVIVCDYNYVFSEIAEVMIPRLGIEMEDIVLIIDEAHNLPERIRENQSMKLTPKMIKDASKQCKREDEQLSYYISDFGQVLSDIDEALPKKIDNEGTREITKMDIVTRLDYLFASTLSGDNRYTTGIFIKELAAISNKFELISKNNHIKPLLKFLEVWMTDEIDILRTHSKSAGSILEIFPMNTARFCHDIFKNVSLSVLMSGTLFPGKMYAEILGMDLLETVIKYYPSPFPTENRLIVGMDIVTTLYKKRNTHMFQAIANQIQEMSRYTTGNIAVFFPSYQLLSEISHHLERCYVTKPTLVEDRKMSKTEKRNIFDKLNELKENGGSIMLAVQGGSLSEGVDYRNNLLDGICIVGLPLSPPTTKIIGLIKYYKGKFGKSKGYYYTYIYPAINKVLQASGRAIRGYNDKAFIVLMDHRFGMKSYMKAFPPDFKYEMVDNVHNYIRKFLKGSHQNKQ
jgi:DNA excision repair protein ERCC-2